MNLARPMQRRRMSLTPMIDVVFLLLVFFMLAARFGVEGSIALTVGTGGAAYEGPPRLVEVLPDGLRLNGVPTEGTALIGALEQLSKSGDDVVVLRARDGADVQRVIDVIELLRNGGFSSVALVE